MRIKLFESFGNITEQEIRGALVGLVDDGYNLLVTQSTFDYQTRQYGIRNGKNGYIVGISRKGHETFNIISVSEPILELIAYFQEKFKDNLLYSIEYMDVNTETEEEIEDLEEFIKDYPAEDTFEVIITLRVTNEN